jgi:hypothetical protein
MIREYQKTEALDTLLYFMYPHYYKMVWKTNTLVIKERPTWHSFKTFWVKLAKEIG